MTSPTFSHIFFCVYLLMFCDVTYTFTYLFFCVLPIFHSNLPLFFTIFYPFFHYTFFLPFFRYILPPFSLYFSLKSVLFTQKTTQKGQWKPIYLKILHSIGLTKVNVSCFNYLAKFLNTLMVLAYKVRLVFAVFKSFFLLWYVFFFVCASRDLTSLFQCSSCTSRAFPINSDVMLSLM